ncbi:tail fiber assembly protein [Pseudomonas mohnii]|uniref:tail fiber assembly protein n=1 Tax=Pseudomonas mohnii TaxID=395600 RepID=UPI0018DCC133|nr:tail fiber assembly protein [Pseudomonas mohnii]MBH8611967.1 tail fiber assembly protein [Pseudomonas mohnii]
MTLYSSKTNKGFYDSDITPNLPADAVELSDELYLSLQQAQRDGKVIDFESEPPVSRDFVMSPEQVLSASLAKRDELLRIATARIAPLQDAVDLGDETGPESVRLAVWKQFRVAVNRIDTSQPNPTWPDLPAETQP